jgi:hypothetical protein
VRASQFLFFFFYLWSSHSFSSTVNGSDEEEFGLPQCTFSQIESGVSWSRDSGRLKAVAIVLSEASALDSVEEKDLSDKAILIAKTMLGRYQHGLEAKRFRLLGVAVDFVCRLSSGDIVAQLTR